MKVVKRKLKNGGEFLYWCGLNIFHMSKEKAIKVTEEVANEAAKDLKEIYGDDVIVEIEEIA